MPLERLSGYGSARSVKEMHLHRKQGILENVPSSPNISVIPIFERFTLSDFDEILHEACGPAVIVSAHQYQTANYTIREAYMKTQGFF